MATEKNWEIYTRSLSGCVNRITNINENTKQPFVQLRTDQAEHKLFFLANIPFKLLPNFETRFHLSKNDKTITYSLGRIIAVNEFKNFREAILKVPLKFFQNTTYRKYLEKFDDIKITPVCYLYLAVLPGHPLYNYIDEGNFFYTKLFLETTGEVFVKINKAGYSYQYFSIFDNSIKTSNYMEQYFLTPYKKKMKEISRTFSGTEDNAIEVLYKNVNIRDNFTGNVLFEVDYRSEADLANVPKREVIQLSKIKENIDLARSLLINLPSLEEDQSITLPSKLEIFKDKVRYVGQELKSSIITPEDFLFNTKKTFPAFPIDHFTASVIYTPVLTDVSAEELNWDIYLREFIKYHWIKATQFPSITLRIGNVDVELKYNKDRRLFYINGKRINKLEVPDVLEKALCSLTQDDYMAVVNAISKTSLEMHNFINSGLTIQLNLSSLPEFMNNSDFLKNESYYFDVSFNIVRIKNLNYIELFEKDQESGEGELVRIRDSRTLMDLNNEVIQWKRFKEVFGQDKAIEKAIDLKVDATQVIEKARKRYVAAFEKSKLLLDSALSELRAKRMTFEGNEGILIDGMSGTQYFIKVSNLDNPLQGDPSCNVVHYPSNSHICIVDKYNNGKQTGLDKVVSRMYALKNDSLVAEHVYTIKGYVDKKSNKK